MSTTEEPDEIASYFEERMRSGFLGIIILYLLNKGTSHAYQIQKDIETITDGVWEPSYSTVWTAMQTLEEKKLIEIAEIGSRRKKKYTITRKGTRTLEISSDKLMGIIKTMRSMLVSFFGLDADYSVKDFF